MYILMALLGMVVSMWLHECGHFIAGRLMGVRPSRINFGNDESFRLFSIMFDEESIPSVWVSVLNSEYETEIKIRFSLLQGFFRKIARITNGTLCSFYINPFGGSVIVRANRLENETDESVLIRHASDRRHFWLTFGGPLTNGCLWIGCLLASSLSVGNFQNLLIAFGMMNFVFMIVNISPGDINDDGYRLLLQCVGPESTRRICSKFGWLFSQFETMIIIIFFLRIYTIISAIS